MLLLIVITIAYGGTFVLSITRGKVPADDLQQKSFRTGHAHAGALVILGLLAPTLEQLNHVRAPYPAISFSILAAALLMPSGLFISAISEGCRSYWDADPALGVLSDRPIRGTSRPRNECSGPYPANPQRRAKPELAMVPVPTSASGNPAVRSPLSPLAVPLLLKPGEAVAHGSSWLPL